MEQPDSIFASLPDDVTDVGLWGSAKARDDVVEGVERLAHPSGLCQHASFVRESGRHLVSYPRALYKPKTPIELVVRRHCFGGSPERVKPVRHIEQRGSHHVGAFAEMLHERSIRSYRLLGATKLLERIPLVE